ncbi:hypothetical protein [Butyrivibrio sp. WCE2006]|uniref:hypothetical protein n=1 Tax=Butyrivibrio sp. WCE2006 TaxID=1410611 RepID=UPI0005D25363|nr:hypothetical protein [Butyrivibrio sp. WCE2006]
MYLNKTRHYLSKSILMVAVIKILVTLFIALFRFFMRKSQNLSPDMLNNAYWSVQFIGSIVKIFSIAIIFYHAWNQMNHDIRVIPKEDREAMRILQLEYFKNNLPSLTASSISKLLQLWSVIFIGSEMLYLFTSIMYRRFISILTGALSINPQDSQEILILLYNMTHGFKYLEILTSLVLGVVTTGIFLKDNYLKLMSITIVVIFILAFGLFQMQTVLFMGKAIGIVWTSVIYHLAETAGLAGFSIYLSVQYKGL